MKAQKMRTAPAAAPSTAAAVPGAAPPAAPLDLGRLDDVGRISAAMTALAGSIAAGTIDLKRARVLAAILGEARELVTTWKHGAPSELAGRDPTDDETDYMVEHGGRLPPGVRFVFRAFRVDGPEWKRGPRPLDDDEAPEPSGLFEN